MTEGSREWIIEFNISKCKYIRFGNVKHEYTYSMVNEANERIKLPKDKEEKDLGIIFEDNLKFDKHILTKVNSGNILIGLTERTLKYKDCKLFSMRYKS